MYGITIFEGTIASMGVQLTPTASGVSASAILEIYPGRRYSIILSIWVSFCRTRKMAFSCHFFSSKVEHSCGQTIKDRHDFSIVLCQLYLLDHQNPSRRTSEFFLVFFGTLQVDPFVKFYCIFNALVQPNLRRWTGFDVPIIFGVKF